MITVWANANGVKVAQLSSTPEDGTPEEQIAHMATLDAYSGFTCVETDYKGTVPPYELAALRWVNNEIVLAPEAVAKIAKEETSKAEVAAIKADEFVKSFVSMTPAQVAAYVENNTSNIADVRALLTKMAVMLLAMAKREYL